MRYCRPDADRGDVLRMFLSMTGKAARPIFLDHHQSPSRCPDGSVHLFARCAKPDLAQIRSPADAKARRVSAEERKRIARTLGPTENDDQPYACAKTAPATPGTESPRKPQTYCRACGRGGDRFPRRSDVVVRVEIRGIAHPSMSPTSTSVPAGFVVMGQRRQGNAAFPLDCRGRGV